MNPGSAQLDMEPIHLLVPSTTAKAITGLEQQHIEAAMFEITGRRNAGESATDHNNINRARHGNRRSEIEKASDPSVDNHPLKDAKSKNQSCSIAPSFQLRSNHS